MQRKVFRIEQMMTAKSLPPTVAMRDEIRALGAQFNVPQADQSGDPAVGLVVELAQIRDAIARHKRDLSDLIGDGAQRRMARAADELDAAVDGMEAATKTILDAAEMIDDKAKALTAALMDNFKRGLAQDIQDQVVTIFEACNFQDVAGQRIGKVMTTLDAIERKVTAMVARYDGSYADIGGAMAAKTAHDAKLLNGPKLDGDAGHASQHDIDKLFS